MQIQQNYNNKNKYSTKHKANEFAMTQVICDLIIVLIALLFSVTTLLKLELFSWIDSILKFFAHKM